MTEQFIEEEHILTDTIKEWSIDQLEEDTEYILCDKIEEQAIHVDPQGITLLRQEDKLKVTIGLEASAKFWNHLFSLPSYLTAQQEVVSSSFALELFDWSVEEPVNMYIRYGFYPTRTELSKIIIQANKLAEDVHKKTIEKLVEQAKELL